MIETLKTSTRINSNVLLILGILTVVASHVSYNIDVIAWFSSVPFLLYLHQTKGTKSRLLFSLSLFVGWTFATAKIVTEPIPFAMVFLFSLPLTLIHLPAYLIWDKFKKYRYAMFLFPCTFTIMEWIQYTFMPFASWGVGANTQIHNLILLQSLSVFGMAGLSFLIYWVNISIVEIIKTGKTHYFNTQFPLIALLILMIFGSLRLELWQAKSKETIKVAAVGTDSEVSGPPFANAEVNNQYKKTLIERTKIAAQQGAKLVSWNEAAVFIPKENEGMWQDSLKQLTQELRISLIASYVVPISIEPLQLENKFLSINSRGEIEYQYLKHQPVPGEPSMKGHEPFRTMRDNGMEIGAAICYDFDYPYIAKAFKRLNTNVVVVPSSDWRGIDPIHTQMSAYRAIEQGYSILRSTRFGLSAVINPMGEIITKQSSFDENNKIMVSELQTQSVTTLYYLIGDLFIYACFVVLIFIFWHIYTERRRVSCINGKK